MAMARAGGGRKRMNQLIKTPGTGSEEGKGSPVENRDTIQMGQQKRITKEPN